MVSRLHEFNVIGDDNYRRDDFRQAVKPDRQMMKDIIEECKNYYSERHNITFKFSREGIEKNPGLSKIMKKVNSISKNDKSPVKLSVIPLGWQLNCHRNSQCGADYLNSLTGKKEWTWTTGYVYMECECKKRINTELHSVLKHIPTGELIDITTDIDKSITYKWFQECEQLHRLVAANNPKLVERFDCVTNSNESCRCTPSSNLTIYHSLSELQKFVFPEW